MARDTEGQESQNHARIFLTESGTNYFQVGETLRRGRDGKPIGHWAYVDKKTFLYLSGIKENFHASDLVEMGQSSDYTGDQGVLLCLSGRELTHSSTVVNVRPPIRKGELYQQKTPISEEEAAALANKTGEVGGHAPKPKQGHISPSSALEELSQAQKQSERGSDKPK